MMWVIKNFNFNFNLDLVSKYYKLLFFRCYIIEVVMEFFGMDDIVDIFIKNCLNYVFMIIEEYK